MNLENLAKGKQPSKIRELFEFANQQKALLGEDKVFDFSIGNPNAPIPTNYKKRLIELNNESSDDAIHSYTSSAGLLTTRTAIANNLNKNYSTSFDGQHIYLTCGASSSLAISMNAILNKDDEVIVFVPYFPEYKIFAEYTEAKVVEVQPDLNTFYPDFSDLEKKITSRTSIVIINTPNNPTGVVYPKEIIVKLTSLLKDKEKEFGHPIYIISDEPYRELIFNDEKHEMIVNYYKNSLITYSFSKSLSIPGDRFGYIAINPECEEKDDLMAAFLGAARSLGYVCAPRPVQEAIVSCLDEQVNLNYYSNNMNNLFKELSAIGYQVTKPAGAFYLFVKSLEEDSNKFSDRAKKFNLVIVPSDSFGIKGYVRLAYCVKSEVVKNSIPAFKALFDSYKE